MWGPSRYMPPESLLGWEACEDVDVYAAGVFGCELLSGVTPFYESSNEVPRSAPIHERCQQAGPIPL